MSDLPLILPVNRTLAIIMGGGAGTRLFPLTKERAKPAVPLGGKYRVVDIPISNCLNSDIRSIYVLTQFNSTSLHQQSTTPTNSTISRQASSRFWLHSRRPRDRIGTRELRTPSGRTSATFWNVSDEVPEPQDLAAEAITELEAVVDDLREIVALVDKEEAVEA